MDGKEDMVHIYNGILLSHKKNEIMPSAITWMDIEMIILNKVKSERERQIPYNFSYVCMHAKSLQSCQALCNPTDYSPPGFSVTGFSRREYYSRLSCPPPGDLPYPGIKP